MKSGYVYIGDQIFESLFAITASEQEAGLMYVKPPTPIMSFLYKQAQVNKFWMKNTPSDLDIIFCNNGKISQICKGSSYSTQIVGDNSLSDLVIELPFGTAKANNFFIGQPVGLLK
jgi:uncharacterized membrane protein (UPF0127 family)